MAALTADKARRQETWKHKSFTLASGTKAFKGARACLNSTGKVVPATATTALLSIGVFDETVDAAAADKLVSVDLEKEVILERFVNGTAGDACAATDVGKLCYLLDDQTVSILPSGKSLAGRIWDVSAKGVAVQKQENNVLAATVAPTGTLPGQVANDFILPAGSVIQDAMYTVGATAAASTVTLPAAAPVGSVLRFVADGVANGHTVTYRDATGAVALTTALTASKRHLVVCVKMSATVWTANAYVSP